MKQSELYEIRKRADSATPGPWEPHQSGHFFDTGPWAEVLSKPEKKTVVKLTWGTSFDQEFIAHSRTDIPCLLDEISRLQDALWEIAHYPDASMFGEAQYVARKALEGK